METFLKIENIKLWARVGVLEEERKLGQLFSLDIFLWTDFENCTVNDDIKKDLINCVRKEIGPIASPDFIQFSSNLPKTRSGKIMRRILRKIAANDYDDLGDTSTLAEPKVVDDLIDNKQNF